MSKENFNNVPNEPAEIVKCLCINSHAKYIKGQVYYFLAYEEDCCDSKHFMTWDKVKEISDYNAWLNDDQPKENWKYLSARKNDFSVKKLQQDDDEELADIDEDDGDDQGD